jgi:autotransporter-associated beta strand protein/T5SS/PEP-CTERM-associated repeat protein
MQIGSRMRQRVCPLMAVLIAALLGGSNTAIAQAVWNGATNNNWFTSSNWSSGTPTSGTTALIVSSNTLATNPTVAGAGAAAASVFVDTGNKLLVTGVGSTLAITNDLSVGFSSAGGPTPNVTVSNVTISNAGALVSRRTFIGDGFNPGVVIVTGAGSTLTTNGGPAGYRFLVGGFGTGTLQVDSGGKVNAGAAGDQRLEIGLAGRANGTLQLGVGGTSGTVNAAQISFGTAGSKIAANNTDSVTLTAAISGPGSVSRSGSGTLILSGSNTYTGGTVISGGTLQLGNGGTTGSIVGNVTNNANFAVNRSDTVVFGGTISGSGAFQQLGTGTTILTGNNTYTGATMITAGKLTAANGPALSAASDFQVNAGATLQLADNKSGAIGSLADGPLGGGSVLIGITPSASILQPDGSPSTVLSVGNSNKSTTFSGAISGPGSLNVTGAGTLTLTGNNNVIGSENGYGLQICACATGGVTIAGGTLNASGGVRVLGGALAVTSGGALNISSSGGMADSSVVRLDIETNMTVTGRGSTVTAPNVTVIGAFRSASNLAIADGGVLNSNGSVLAGSFSDPTAVARTSVTGARSIWNIGASLTLGQVGAAHLTVADGGIVNLTSGIVVVSPSSALNLGVGGLAGSINSSLGVFNNGQIVANFTDTLELIDSVQGGGSLTKQGSGVLTLSGTNTYTGATTINGGTLSVNGSIASSSLTTVNAGATLGGNGTVGNTTINSGTLAPGNSIGTLAVQGNLVFTAAASYMVEVSPANADRTNVTGTATLGGATVKASFAAGTYVEKQYTILNATGGISGTFNALANTDLPANFKSSLSYDSNNAYLNLALNFIPPPGSGLNANQQSAANAIVGFFNTNGTIPLVFGGLTPAGLTQISGEVATGTQQTTFNAMNQFMGVLTDPFIAGRGDPVTSSSASPQFADDETASAYASNGKPRSKSERDAYAAVYRKAPPMADPFTQRWSVWAAGYGGSQTTDGNMVLGSNNTRSSIGGVAVGADYRFSPYTIAGFALAGGATNFSVNGLGSGRSDLFQAGAFVRHNVGAAYLTGALAYGWQDITTDRTVTVAGTDLLRAQFNANAFSGRVEGGYRFLTPWIGGVGITPYAAGQFVTFDLPAYAEQAIAGANTFALSYASKSVTDSRSEFGLRTDKSYPMRNGIFTLRGRAAWAHDFNTDRSITPTFLTLPGASFVVNGAAPAHDSALVTASAEMKWLNGFALAGTFEGEFSNATTSYAGKGVLRYAW